MRTIAGLADWVKQGRQRAAVFGVLRQPLTSSHILRQARVLAPKLRKQDVWLILKKLRERHLAMRLNLFRPTGRLHCLTHLGRRVFRRLHGMEVVAPCERTDWDLYADLLVARVRREVLLEVARAPPPGTRPNSATVIRRRLFERRRGLSLNAVLRALTELKADGLVWSGARRPADYQATAHGATIAEVLAEIHRG